MSAVIVAGELRAAHRNAKRILGVNFRQRIQPVMNEIDVLAVSQHRSRLDVTVELADKLVGQHRDPFLIYAAFVELQHD